MSEDERPDRDDEQPKIKVTDRRMFTETGELRDEFDGGDDEDEGAAAEPPTQPPPRSAPTGPPPRPAGAPSAGDMPPGGGTGPVQPPGAASDAGPTEPPPGYGTSSRQPQFLDLVAMLAEPAALFLGDASMPGQEPIEDLERARIHIDMLALLQEKSRDNLTSQEATVLNDLIYRLRLRYVEKKG